MGNKKNYGVTMVEVGSFYLQREETANGTTLKLCGELDLAAAQEFRAVAVPLAERSGHSLTLNLKELTYIDSTGIGVMILVLKTRDKLNEPLAIVEIPAKIGRLFDLTGISRLIAEVPFARNSAGKGV